MATYSLNDIGHGYHANSGCNRFTASIDSNSNFNLEGGITIGNTTVYNDSMITIKNSYTGSGYNSIISTFTNDNNLSLNIQSDSRGRIMIDVGDPTSSDSRIIFNNKITDFENSKVYVDTLGNGSTNNLAASTEHVTNKIQNTNIEDLNNVIVNLGSLNINDALVWNGSEWTSGTVSSGSLSLQDLINVNNSLNPSTGDLLKWNGSEWTSGTVSLQDLNNVNNSLNPSTGDLLKWNGSHWTSEDPYTQGTGVFFESPNIISIGQEVFRHSIPNFKALTVGDYDAAPTLPDSCKLNFDKSLEYTIFQSNPPASHIIKTMARIQTNLDGGAGGGKLEFSTRKGNGVLGNEPVQRLIINNQGLIEIPYSTDYIQNPLKIAYNADVYATIGRAYVGYTGFGDYASFGHIDMRSASEYGFLHSMNGSVFVNAGPGNRSIHLRNSNVDYARIFWDRKYEIYGSLSMRSDFYEVNGTFLHASLASPNGYDWWTIRTSNMNSGHGIEGHSGEDRGDLFIVTTSTRSNGEYFEGVFLQNRDSTRNLNFTGQHRVIMNINLQKDIGLIVSASGKYVNIDSSTKTNINEALPICILSSVKKDKRVFGVISNKEDSSMSRTYDQGNIKHIGSKKFNNERRFIINSLGEGSIWVINTNGFLKNGDYITTSNIPGYGELQDEDVLKNYTVAKISCDCNFSLDLKGNKVVRKNIKKWIEKKKIWQTVKHEEEKTRNVFNKDLGKWVQEKYTETREIQEQVFDEYDVYNEDGKVIDVHKVEKVEHIEREEYEIVYDENGDVILDDELDSDGNIVYDYAYPTRFLNGNGEEITRNVYEEMLNKEQTVYIACFVGCTYHCG